MLKIKDNVDLKELEKYGFQKDRYNNYSTKKTVVIPCYCYECENSEEDTGHEKIFEDQINFIIDKNTKMFNKMTYGTENMDYDYFFNVMQPNAFDLLYDLIKADLVEKVD